MALKLKTNSLRCDRWRGFAKQALAKLKEAELPGKTFVIDGYKIIIKALIDLAIVKAPPGIVIFRRASDEIEVHYADSIKMKPRKIEPLQPFRSSMGEIHVVDNNYGGNYVPIAREDDSTLLFWVGTMSPGLPPIVGTTAGERILGRSMCRTPTAFKVGADYTGGIYIQPDDAPRMFSIANVGDNRLGYSLCSETAEGGTAAVSIWLGGASLDGGSSAWFTAGFPVDPQTEEEIGYGISWFFPTGADWKEAEVRFAYSWAYDSSYFGKRVIRTVHWISAIVDAYTDYREYYFLFTEMYPDYADYPDNVVLYGYTDWTNIFLLDTSLGHVEQNGYFGNDEYAIPSFFSSWVSYPGSWTLERSIGRTVACPLADGEFGLFYYDCYDDSTGEPTDYCRKYVINPTDEPYINAGLTMPFLPSVYIAQGILNSVLPACVLADVDDGAYLFWVEKYLYDADYKSSPIDIVEFKYGSPYASWVNFPTPPGVMTNFTPIKVTFAHRIILATVFISGDGMYTATLDTEKSADWVLGKKFSDTRLDRCCPTYFGEHPYVTERRKYSGTQWAWDYSIAVHGD